MKENRRVVNAKTAAGDDSGRIVEVITNTAARAAAQYEFMPPEARDRLSIAEPSATVEAVLGLPIAEAMTRRYRMGFRHGALAGAVGTFLVLHELAMLLRSVR